MHYAMKIALIYDFGVKKGGGDYVMLNVIEALLSMGCNVSLITSNPLGMHETAKLFNKTPPKINVSYVHVPHFFKHPYNIAYMARRTNWEEYDIYILSDDIPKCISHKEGICYAHYPHAARLKHKEYLASRYKVTIKGRIKWWIHKTFFPRFYLTDNIPEGWIFIANSAVTKNHISETFNLNSEAITLLNPPVGSSKIYKSWKENNIDKEDLVISIGRFEPEKRFIDVLYAMAHLKNKVECKLNLIGFTSCEGKLSKIIKDFGLQESVKLLVNVGRQVIIDRLLRAKAIIHPAPYEPFGVAVVEGMAAGCIPIVRKGLNGPWIEIIKKGRHGLGFKTVEEMASDIEKVIRDYSSFDVKAVVLRALEFDEVYFKNEFSRIARCLFDEISG